MGEVVAQRGNVLVDLWRWAHAERERHNAASADGGGLYLNYGDTYLYGDLTDNSAGSDGGGLYAHGRPIFENPPSSTTSIIQVSGGDVSRNTVEGNGGGIYFDRPGSTLTVKSGARRMPSDGIYIICNMLFLVVNYLVNGVNFVWKFF